jgi:hypothetical protein
MLIIFENQPSSAEVRAELKREAKPVLLSFSAGKDAVGVWVAIQELGIEVVPFYMFLVPDLEFVEVGLQYYEKFFGQRIRRYPHPSLHRMLRTFTFQAPENLAILEHANLPDFDYSDLETRIKSDLKLPLETWTLSGVRASDSLNRRTSIMRHGPFLKNKQKCLPIWDWKNNMLSCALRGAGVKLTVDYKMFGRSFDGIDARFLGPIKTHFPRDFEKIIEFFPLAELELFRQENL